MDAPLGRPSNPNPKFLVFVPNVWGLGYTELWPHPKCLVQCTGLWFVESRPRPNLLIQCTRVPVHCTGLWFAELWPHPKIYYDVPNFRYNVPAYYLLNYDPVFIAWYTCTNFGYTCTRIVPKSKTESRCTTRLSTNETKRVTSGVTKHSVIVHDFCSAGPLVLYS